MPLRRFAVVCCCRDPNALSIEEGMLAEAAVFR